MSPFSTFQSCGSSSSEVLRISRPTGVMRGSFLSFWVSAHSARAAGSRARCASSRFSASTTIERSFQMRKTRPPLADAVLAIEDRSAVAGDEKAEEQDDRQHDGRRQQHRDHVERPLQEAAIGPVPDRREQPPSGRFRPHRPRHSKCTIRSPTPTHTTHTAPAPDDPHGFRSVSRRPGFGGERD